MTIKKVACIGAGVIGAGWAARLVENGMDVAFYDPDPEAPRKVSEVMANAERVYAKLTMAPRPEPGAFRFCETLADAVADADMIIESAPERIELKRRVYAEIEEAASPDALITSSTSGYKPTDLQAEMKRPDRLLVAHPFNPVYLLPVVEIVPGELTAPEAVERAMAFFPELGMKPLKLRKEIDAFIADRLMEALWREGLWLVKDGIGTTEEIDDAMRYGFGLRWAQMGLFETFRIAGGEAGMRHFLAQFGPALKWPWTKLMDTPEMDDALVEMIAGQSDDQAKGRSIRELERIRDDNLVSILQALKVNNWGAGEILAEYERKLYDRGAVSAPTDEADFSQPIRTVDRRIPPDWTDYNNHMTESRYLQLFSEATDALLRMAGVDADYVASGGSYFTAETHINHLDEVKALEQVTATTQVIMLDGKKLHLYHRLFHSDGRLLATSENMQLHVDMTTRRAAPPAPHILEKLEAIATAHAGLEQPADVGRFVGKPRR